MTTAGAMRERVTVRGRLPATPNEYGEPVAGEQAGEEVWASVEPLGGPETTRAGRVESEASYKVTIRFLPWLTAAHWLAWKGRRLEIDEVTDVGARGEWHELTCREAGAG